MLRAFTSARTGSTASASELHPRQRILVAAMTMIRDRGLVGMSQGKLAELAGLRQSHLTYYFPTRNDLLKAIAERVRDEAMAALPSLESDATRRSERMAEVRGLLVRRACEPFMPRLMMALMVAAEEDPSLASWIADLEGQAIGHLGRVFETLGLHPKQEELHLLHAALAGASIFGTAARTSDSRARVASVAGLAFDRVVKSAKRDKA